MNLTSAMSSALSGLAANARQADALSSNVANATTPGYARRSVSLSANVLGGAGQGVTVNGTLRHVDLYLLNDRRAEAAGASGSKILSSFLSRAEAAFGDPQDEGAITARISALDASLLTAASHPDSEARLAAVADAARSLANGLNDASSAIQAERLKADQEIGAAVGRLNEALVQVRELNGKIATLTGAGRDASALLDKRARIVDGIAALVPLREVPRDNGQIALITTGGAVLLDGKESVFGFTPAATVVPEMTLESGGLSGLTLNGRPMPTTGQAGLVRGGELAALFQVRDTLATDAQAKLDALALDLCARFADPLVDPTLAPGAPGLFTDAGAAPAAADETGLSARIAFNTLADPRSGGALRLLRDGLGSTVAGPTGEATRLVALSDALNARLLPASATVAPASRSLVGLASDILSGLSTDRLTAESETAFLAARHQALAEAEAAQGVDIDAEMQALLVIEKNYAANAKVLQAVDDMLSTLLGL